MERIAERMTAQEQIIYSAKFMFEREITDIAGGNISVRDGDTVYMTPTLAGNQYHWDIDPINIVIGQLSEEETLKKHPRFTERVFRTWQSIRHSRLLMQLSTPTPNTSCHLLLFQTHSGDIKFIQTVWRTAIP